MTKSDNQDVKIRMERNYIISPDGEEKIEIGLPHPTLVPKQIDSKIFSVETGVLSFHIWFSPPMDFEIECVEGVWAAIGLHLREECIIPIVAFQPSPERHEVSFFFSPLQASPEAVERYIGYDANGAAFLTLMETVTGIVRTSHRLILPPDMVTMFKAALKFVPHPCHLSAESWRAIESAGVDALWKDRNTKRWVWDCKLRRFQVG
ncbi:hypothetical protein [Rhodopila sp.]|uniref:hypothetical protein n=1 Tax=Rhodopila sp. TaxID=2480087 RepID=UPI003D0F8F04